MKLFRDVHIIISYGRGRDRKPLRTGAGFVQRINEKSLGLGYRRAALAHGHTHEDDKDDRWPWVCQWIICFSATAVYHPTCDDGFFVAAP
jgi:hypothetical protein